MKSWKKTLMSSDNSIIEAMRIIDESSMQIALVVDQNGHLIGIVTDGDIRRGFLKGIPIDQPVKEIMNREFTTVTFQAGRQEVLSIMRQKTLRQIPVLDDSGCVIDLKIMDDMIQQVDRENEVVLMAGGVGSRLQPLTDDCPKPLLKVGSKPIMEIILDNFIDFGFKKFYISVNYMAEMIVSYFGDGSRWGVQIQYIHEDKALGTAGSLGSLPIRPVAPLIVMNADVLTKVNFQHLLDFHNTNKSKATMCVRDYHVQVPFGVVVTEQQRLVSIDEKPTHRFFVNAGIYVLEPEIIDLIPKESFLDMNILFERLITKGWEAVAFPIREYWMDVGRLDDFERANGEFVKVFR
jgi:dTDP-glucose pyrophosphorylase